MQAVLHTELQVCYADVDAFFALLAPTSDGRIRSGMAEQGPGFANGPSEPKPFRALNICAAPSRAAFTAAVNSLTWPQFTKLVLHLRHSQRPRPASRDARKIMSLLQLPRSPDDASMPAADAATASPATTPLRARARSYNLLTAARAAASAVVTRAVRLVRSRRFTHDI